MALVSTYWQAAEDLHLTPGLVSPRLDHLLSIEDTTGNTRADTPPAGVSVTFTARFVGAPSAFGVKLDTTTHEISIASPLPAPPRPRSFLVVAQATEAAATPAPSVLRVHVHPGITKIWVTPERLTARQGAQNVRLSVLAQFSDGVIGDISNWAPFPAGDPKDDPDPKDRTYVRESTSTDPFFSWFSDDPGTVAVDPRTGLLDIRLAAGTANLTVRHGPPAAAPTTPATVVPSAPWKTPVQLRKLAGPGFAAMKSVPNILVLPDGFEDTPQDFAAWNKLTNDLVKRLSTNPRVRPFDLLAPKLNYFTAWVPSSDAGVTVLNELDRGKVKSGVIEGTPVEPPRVAHPAKWELPDLIAEVGLPTPVDDPPGSALGTAARGRLHDWQALYGAGVTAGQVGPLFATWLALDDRVLLNERDTAFHTAISVRPRADGFSNERDAGINPRRLDGADFDAFLGALQDDQGTAVGSVWAGGGKDQDQVVILCRSNRVAGANGPRAAGGHLIALSLGLELAHQLTAATNGFDVHADTVPATINPATWTRTAHELAHSWALLDEYGGTLAVNKDIDKMGNVQPRSQLLDVGGQLMCTKLKWRWPRIAEAGVLRDKPAPEGAGFRVPLVAGHARAFKKGNRVRLRTKNLLGATLSPQVLDVTRPDGNDLLVTVVSGGALAPASWPAGSVVLRPIPGPAGTNLELVADSVRTRIEATHNPLNAFDVPGNRTPANQACVNPPGSPFDLTQATNFPNGKPPKPPRASAWIVGLFQQGASNDCDVYRPTGICLMRQLTFVNTSTKAKRQDTYQFCPVCRYVIVDRIDPAQHGAIDKDFAPRYPA